jgi:hypothetical protein
MTRATARVTPPSVRGSSTVRAGTPSPRTGSRATPRPELRLVPGPATVRSRRRAPRALRAGNAARAQEVQRLEQQVVSGGAPAEIARAAVEAGMVPAGPAAYLVIDPDGGSVLRGTPIPAEAPTPGDGG